MKRIEITPASIVKMIETKAATMSKFADAVSAFSTTVPEKLIEGIDPKLIPGIVYRLVDKDVPNEIVVREILVMKYPCPTHIEPAVWNRQLRIEDDIREYIEWSDKQTQIGSQLDRMRREANSIVDANMPIADMLDVKSGGYVISKRAIAKLDAKYRKYIESDDEAEFVKQFEAMYEAMAPIVDRFKGMVGFRNRNPFFEDVRGGFIADGAVNKVKVLEWYRASKK